MRGPSSEQKHRSGLIISFHAAERWVERVDRGASLGEARLAVGRFAALGRVRPTPRHWMRGYVRQEPGTTFIYNAGRSDACAVVVEGVIVTVVTKAMFEYRSRRHLSAVPDSQPPSASERARWRWNREIEVDEAA